MAPVGYCTLSEKGRILETNLATATLLDLARDRLVNHQLSQFIFKEDQTLYYLHCKHLFETGKPLEWDLRMVKNDETAFWAHIESTVAQDADGAPVGRIVWTKTKTPGLLLVKMLGQHQLRGKIEVDCTGGTAFRLRFAPRIARIYE